jgi:hypothetical protein
VPKSNSNFGKNIFINCPFGPKYKPMLRALLFTLVYCGFEPRIASENLDSLEIRLPKIKDLVKESKYSIHDISRIRATKKGEHARFNMPFELGIDYGSRIFGNNQFSKKKCLILESERYDFAKSLSDLSGVDIMDHKSEPEELVHQVRTWIRGIKKDVKSGSQLWNLYNEFWEHFDAVTKTEGFNKKDINKMQPPEFIDYIKAWIQGQSNSKNAKRK